MTPQLRPTFEQLAAFLEDSYARPWQETKAEIGYVPPDLSPMPTEPKVRSLLSSFPSGKGTTAGAAAVMSSTRPTDYVFARFQVER